MRRPAAGRVHELPGGGVAEGGPAEGGDVDMREVPAAENAHELPGDGVTKEEPAEVPAAETVRALPVDLTRQSAASPTAHP